MGTGLEWLALPELQDDADLEGEHPARVVDRAARTLPHLPLAAITRHAQTRVGVEHLLDRHAALHLVDRLVRVEQRRDGIGLARIRLPLRIREAERVLGIRLIERVADDCELGALAYVEVQLDVAEIASSDAVFAVAVSLKRIAGNEVTRRRRCASELDDRVPCSVAAADDLCLRHRWIWTVLGEHRDHAAGRVAVQRGEWAAHDLDAFG